MPYHSKRLRTIQLHEDKSHRRVTMAFASMNLVEREGIRLTATIKGEYISPNLRSINTYNNSILG